MSTFECLDSTVGREPRKVGWWLSRLPGVVRVNLTKSEVAPRRSNGFIIRCTAVAVVVEMIRAGIKYPFYVLPQKGTVLGTVLGTVRGRIAEGAGRPEYGTIPFSPELIKVLHSDDEQVDAPKPAFPEPRPDAAITTDRSGESIRLALTPTPVPALVPEPAFPEPRPVEAAIALTDDLEDATEEKPAETSPTPGDARESAFPIPKGEVEQIGLLRACLAKLREIGWTVTIDQEGGVVAEMEL